MFDQKEYAKQHYTNNIEKYKEQMKEWNRNNPKYAKEYHKNNREKRLKQMESWREDNLKYIKEYSRRYRENNCAKVKEANINWRKNNPEYNKQYLKDNRKIMNEHTKKWQKNKRKIDPKFRLNCNMSYMIWKVLKGNKGGEKCFNLLPYTIEGLMKNLEKKFTLRMNWNNYGNYWEIDHIIPKSKFNYNKPNHVDFKRCWSLENLRPLEISENRKKSNKLSRPFQPALQI